MYRHVLKFTYRSPDKLTQIILAVGDGQIPKTSHIEHD